MKRTLIVAFILFALVVAWLVLRQKQSSYPYAPFEPAAEQAHMEKVNQAVKRVINDGPETATITDPTDPTGPFRVTGSVASVESPSGLPNSALVRPDPNLPPLTYKDPSPDWVKARMDAAQKQTNQ